MMILSTKGGREGGLSGSFIHCTLIMFALLTSECHSHQHQTGMGGGGGGGGMCPPPYACLFIFYIHVQWNP